MLFLHTKKITLRVLKNFLGDDYEYYKGNTEALTCWADIIRNKDVVVALNILTSEQYDKLFDK